MTVAAVDADLDDELVQELLALRPSVDQRTWTSGLAENNGPVAEVRQR